MWVVFFVCFGAYAHGSRSDRARDVLATLYFEIDSAHIKPEFEDDLKKVQAALAADATLGLHIEGYSRYQGRDQNSREISQQRVLAVQQWFSKHGIEKNRLLIKTYAAAGPQAQKNGPKDPALSERVEILRVSLKQPVAFLPATRYEFDPVVEGRQVSHDFIVQNKGSALLEIKRVNTD